jgi:ketosteroid isomerase-like protein
MGKLTAGATAVAVLFTLSLAAFGTPARADARGDIKADWQTFLGNFDGPITVELTDLDVGADRNLAYSHSIQHVAGTDKEGKKLDLTVRVTDVYQKIGAGGLSPTSMCRCPSTLAPTSPISPPNLNLAGPALRIPPPATSIAAGTAGGARREIEIDSELRSRVTVRGSDGSAKKLSSLPSFDAVK